MRQRRRAGVSLLQVAVPLVVALMLALVVTGFKRTAVSPLRILSIDGGGIRGLIPLQMLRAIEAEANGVPVHELFDMFVGTSTGGIIAVCLGILKMSIPEIEQLYLDLGADVFDQSLFDKIKTAMNAGEAVQYDAANLERLFKNVIKQKLGRDSVRLSDEIVRKSGKKVVLVSATAHVPKPTPYLFRNYEDHGNSAYAGSNSEMLWEALRATSAAATYFAPIQLESGLALQDGGMVHNNPSLVAFFDAQRVFKRTKTNVTIVSLGTGDVAWTFQDTGLKLLLKQVIELSTSASATAHSMAISFAKQRNSYFRFDPPLGYNEVELDTISAQKLAVMRQSADLWIRSPNNHGELTRLVAILKAT